MIEVTAAIITDLIEVTAEIESIQIITGGSGGGSYQIYVNGVLNQSGTSTNFSTETFNITA